MAQALNCPGVARAFAPQSQCQSHALGSPIMNVQPPALFGPVPLFNLSGIDEDAYPNLTFSLHEVFRDFASSMFVFREPGNVALISCYVPLFILATVSNALVIGVVSKYNHLRSVTNYFLVNLSVADLLVTFICMPMAIGRAVNRLWLYGDIMCKLTYYLQGVSVGASVFTITVMSIDRYLAIQHPIAFRKVFNRRSTIMVIIALWCVALLLFAPLLVVRQLSRVVVAGMDHQLVFCIEKWPTPADRLTYSIVCFVVVYAVPGSIVILAYSLMGRRLCAASLLQQMDAAAAATPGVARHQAGGERLVRDRKRVARILLLLAILFALCWLPYNILNLLLDLDERHPHSAQILELLPFTLLLGHANSAINPLLYCFLTRNFRNTVKQMCAPACKCCRGRRTQRNQATRGMPLNQNGQFCSTYQLRGYKAYAPRQPTPKQLAADCDETPTPANQPALKTSDELMEMQVLQQQSGSAPGAAESHSVCSFSRSGRHAQSSSSGYDSCPAALLSSQGANTYKLVDHSPHRKCYLRGSQHFSTPAEAPVSAQQCHF